MGDWERRHVVERAPHVSARDHEDVATVLVTVKAYPAIGKKNGEAVCVAGVRLDTDCGWSARTALISPLIAATTTCELLAGAQRTALARREVRLKGVAYDFALALSGRGDALVQQLLDGWRDGDVDTRGALPYAR